MRFHVQRDDFARLLAGNAKVVQTRNTIPILSHILLCASGDTLSVRGTDLDVDIASEMHADVDADGSVCVDAKMLTDIVKKMTGDTVSLDLKDDVLTAKAGRSRFKLKTLPAADFPQMGEPEYDAEFDIDLAALLAPVAFAMSDEETRYYLYGALLHPVDDKLAVVATDGHRLARNAIEHDAAASLEGMSGIIIPRKTVGLLPKGSIKLAVSTTKIRITASDGTVIVSKLVDGTFPDYNRVIPRDNPNRVTFDRDAMMKAADRVSTVSSERGRGVKLTIGEGEIALSVRAGDEAEDAIEGSGEPAEIGFNAVYLRDILTVMPAGEVCLALNDGGSPGVLTSAAAPEWLGVLMPMRVG